MHTAVQGHTHVVCVLYTFVPVAVIAHSTRGIIGPLHTLVTHPIFTARAYDEVMTSDGRRTGSAVLHGG